jgi:hypothetical protein
MRGMGDQLETMIAQMVLDGIVEIEANGQMVSGTAAYDCLYERRESPASDGPLGALSRAALEYAQALDIPDARALSARLYAYNSVPASRRWRRLFLGEHAMESYLGIRLAATVTAEAWIGWHSASARRHDAMPVYKLYVSPLPGELRDVFAVVAETVARSPAYSWKVGNGMYGVLRPDKLVVYFETFEDLQATAADLLAKLQGCPAQGVPFTAAVSEGPLLSWGIDPAPEELSVPWLQRESWRTRICNRLASALTLAKNESRASMSPAQFAAERLRFEGIDTNTWAPCR